MVAFNPVIDFDRIAIKCLFGRLSRTVAIPPVGDQVDGIVRYNDVKERNVPFDILGIAAVINQRSGLAFIHHPATQLLTTDIEADSWCTVSLSSRSRKIQKFALQRAKCQAENHIEQQYGKQYRFHYYPPPCLSLSQ